MNQDTIIQYLNQAVELATLRQGFTAPNPAVGAVIANAKGLVAQGLHEAAGLPHAEVMAFKASQDQDLSDATLFVSLEPCCHHGRTPPCTDAIIASGIKRVYFAHQDSNPEVAGKSAAILKRSGVVAEYVPTETARQLYRSYDYWREHEQPWVTAKLAVSRDGCYRSVDGSPVAITADRCRQFTHWQRLRADGLVTTVQTVLCDDPQLNVRLHEKPLAKPVFVLDRLAEMPLDARLWRTAESLFIIHGPDADSDKVLALAQQGAQCIAVPLAGQHISWPLFMAVLGVMGLHHVWLEAGAEVFTSLWREGQLQDGYLYVGNKVIGDVQCSAQLAGVVGDQQWADMVWRSLGDDWVAYSQFEAGRQP